MFKYTIEGEMIQCEVPGKDYYYTTNKSGDGLFRVDTDRKQLKGTAQFSVAGLTSSSKKAKIREIVKIYEGDDEE